MSTVNAQIDSYTWLWTGSGSGIFNDEPTGWHTSWRSKETVEPPAFTHAIALLAGHGFKPSVHDIHITRSQTNKEPYQYAVHGGVRFVPIVDPFSEWGLILGAACRSHYYSTPKGAIEAAQIRSYGFTLRYALPMGKGQVKLAEKLAREIAARYAEELAGVIEITGVSIERETRGGKYGRYSKTATSAFTWKELCAPPAPKPRKTKGVCAICGRNCIAAPGTEPVLAEIRSTPWRPAAISRVVVEPDDMICRRHCVRSEWSRSVYLGDFDYETEDWLTGPRNDR